MKPKAINETEKTAGPFRAVDVAELRRVLGSQCSPDWNRSGYVVGPDISGRICHVASCFSLQEAKKTARAYNDNWRAKHGA